jgi:hypothetical protein
LRVLKRFTPGFHSQHPPLEMIAFYLIYTFL